MSSSYSLPRQIRARSILFISVVIGVVTVAAFSLIPFGAGGGGPPGAGGGQGRTQRELDFGVGYSGGGHPTPITPLARGEWWGVSGGSVFLMRIEDGLTGYALASDGEVSLRFTVYFTQSDFGVFDVWLRGTEASAFWTATDVAGAREFDSSRDFVTELEMLPTDDLADPSESLGLAGFRSPFKCRATSSVPPPVGKDGRIAARIRTLRRALAEMAGEEAK